MKLTWTPQPGAARYRLLLRDTGDNRFIVKTGALSEPAFELDDSHVEPGHRYEWRPQWRGSRRSGEWRDVHPPLHLAPPADPARTTRLTWDDADGIYRVVIRDEAADAIVAKHAVRGSSYVVDWSLLD